MNLSRSFRSPFVRVPFIAFAVVATVATSAPEWNLDARAVDEGITLAPGATFEKKVAYEGSHPVRIESQVTGSAEAGTKVRVEHDDSNGGPIADAGYRNDVGRVACDDQFTYVSKEPGKWAIVRKDGVANEWTATSAHSTSSCDSKQGVATVKIENDGSSEVKLHVTVRATIGGSDDEAPDGAFVRAKVVP